MNGLDFVMVEATEVIAVVEAAKGQRVTFEVARGHLSVRGTDIEQPAVRVTPRLFSYMFPPEFFPDSEAALLGIAAWRPPERYVLARLLEVREALEMVGTQHMSKPAWAKWQVATAALARALEPSLMWIDDQAPETD